jgi:hypothetical protein
MVLVIDAEMEFSWSGYFSTSPRRLAIAESLEHV